MKSRRVWSMGQVLLILALAALISFPREASAQTPSPQPQDQDVVVTAVDDGGQIYLSAGQTLVVRLQANPSTGYGWQVREPVTEEIIRPAQEGEFQAESSLLGAPATQVLRFEGVGGGETTLRLEYRRPWEVSKEPAGTFHLRVRTSGPFSAAPTLNAEGASVGEALSAPFVAPAGLPPTFDWCQLNGCTPVRDQGQCGSCWAFATVGPLELNVVIRGGLAADLSEQYLVSCNMDRWGCNGGWWAHDYHAWRVPTGDQGAGGVVEALFPYLGRDDPCDPPHVHEYQIAEWHFVKDEWAVAPVVDIKQAIYEAGPVATAVCVNAAFQSYDGGVFEGPGCSVVNHAVVLVGWDDEQGSSGVWLLRNSWGNQWGEDGYMRVPYGLSNVGFGANYVVYVPSPCYNLSYQVSPDSAGTVTRDPGPNCGEVQYQPGTEVQVSAVPASGWRFVNWSGAMAGEQPDAVVVVDSHKSVTAHFQSEACIPWFLLPLGVAICWSYRKHRSQGK